MAGKVRRFFAGGNTSEGFYSLYDYMIKPDAKRLFILKGGPGTGKSTFMRFIGDEMHRRGYDLEYHHCSSDANSIDGVVIKDADIALVDGTAPHIVDPKNPGVVDEIINLGEFWDEEGIASKKENVMKVNKRVGRLFKIAYSHLKEAKVIHDEWESYITESMNFAPINELTYDILEEVFGGIEPDFRKVVKQRHLFGRAFTPQGEVNKLDTILNGAERVYVLSGEPGSGKSTLMSHILDKASRYGIFAEVYHSPMAPEKIDFLVLPNLKIAFITEVELLNLDLSEYKTIEHDFDHFINNEIVDSYEAEIADCKKRYYGACNRALSFIRKAKLAHDELEKYYVTNMDFERINKKKREILERILKYVENK